MIEKIDQMIRIAEEIGEDDEYCHEVLEILRAWRLDA